MDEIYRCSPNATFYPQQCNKTHQCHIPLLRSTPGLSQGLVEQLTTNLKVNVYVPYLGGSVSTTIWDEVVHRRPVLFYSWQPRVSILGIPHNEFIRIGLPPRHRTDCVENLTYHPDGDMNCDYPWQILMKVWLYTLCDCGLLVPHPVHR